MAAEDPQRSVLVRQYLLRLLHQLGYSRQRWYALISILQDSRQLRLMTSHDFFHDLSICNYQRSLTKLGGWSGEASGDPDGLGRCSDERQALRHRSSWQAELATRGQVWGHEDIPKWCALVSDLEEILYHLDTSGHPEGPFGKLTSNLHEPCIDRSLSVVLGHAGACLGYSYWTPNLKTVVIYRKLWSLVILSEYVGVAPNQFAVIESFVAEIEFRIGARHRLQISANQCWTCWGSRHFCLRGQSDCFLLVSSGASFLASCS